MICIVLIMNSTVNQNDCSGMGSLLSCSAAFFALRVQRHVCLCWYFSGTSFIFKSKLSDTEVKQKSVHFFLGLFLVENHLYFQCVEAQASILVKLIKKQFLPPGWTKAQMLVGGQFCPFWGCKSTPWFPKVTVGLRLGYPYYLPFVWFGLQPWQLEFVQAHRLVWLGFQYSIGPSGVRAPASQQCGHYTRHYVILIVEWGQ